MAEITAKLVNELRAKTGQPMMDCKKMLEKTGGGLLVEPDDCEALADALLAIWKDPEIGRGGVAGVRRHYSVARMAARTLEVYASLGSPVLC